MTRPPLGGATYRPAMERQPARRGFRPPQRSTTRSELATEDDLRSPRAGSRASATAADGDPFTRLQRTAGNRAVTALVVQRLWDDRPWEKEATPEEGASAKALTDSMRMTTELMLAMGLPELATGEVAGWKRPGTEPAKATLATTRKSPGHLSLRKGSRGPAVVALQKRLNERGADPPLSPDGIFGEQTREAVVAYQLGHDLKADGIAGRLTLASLKNA